ncbi:MAG: winged helix-turn-helix domain-containing protein [Thermoguttaceae bacterium]|nr:winged helix-turn-helix domain-containing protein [Thermoguttaceae bacterium]
MARIKVGKCYIAKLSKGDAPIRIESVHEDGGWVARTLLTSRITRIKTAEQIVRVCEDSELEEYTNRSNERVARPSEETVSPEPVEVTEMTESQETVETPAEDITPEEETTDDIYVLLRRKPKTKMTLLDAAHRVLSEFGDELSATDIVKAAIEKGYWQTEGKTPGNTLNAAITRDIKAKGEESRFAKGTRGRFTTRS